MPEGLVWDRVYGLRVRLAVCCHSEAALSVAMNILSAGEERRHAMSTGGSVELPTPAQAAPIADVHNVRSLMS